jgi:general secretion pathway protein G
MVGALIAIVSAVTVARRGATPPVDNSATLRTQLTELRGAIAKYRATHGHGPVTLQELVNAKLLREVPVDPITRSRTTWRLVTEESVTVQEDFRAGGGDARRIWIIDVHSGAAGSDPAGRAWSDY